MKKIKMMLTAVALMAVVGGAVAFKVRVQHTFYQYNATAISCNLPVFILSTIDPRFTIDAPFGFSTTISPWAKCTLVLKVSI